MSLTLSTAAPQPARQAPRDRRDTVWHRLFGLSLIHI